MELKDATVLLVDDEPMLPEVYCELLEQENYHVLSVGDGAAALQILRNHHVDVIVSDVRMPVMDGIHLLKNLATYAGASLDRLTHHVRILEMNGDSYRLPPKSPQPA